MNSNKVSKSFFIKKQSQWARKRLIAKATGRRARFDQYSDWLAELVMLAP